MRYSLANIPMKNYLVASSSPLTESVERIECCQAAGFAAAILKSCADYHRTGTGYGRKVVYVEDGYYADASFENEILTLSEGLQLFSEASAKVSNKMLLIPSVSASTLAPDKWISSCEKFRELGARLIQLDFFYLGTLQHNDVFYEKLTSLLTALNQTVGCQVMPKLNLRFNAEKICSILKNCGIQTVSLLDSMREDPDEKYGLHKGTTSYFGPRLFSSTRHYLQVAKQYGLEVCAGGGVSCKKDIEQLLREDADMVQVASYLLNRNYKSIQDLLPTDIDCDFTNPILLHNPWCDYLSVGNCDRCGGCAKHPLP